MKINGRLIDQDDILRMFYRHVGALKPPVRYLHPSYSNKLNLKLTSMQETTIPSGVRPIENEWSDKEFKIRLVKREGLKVIVERTWKEFVGYEVAVLEVLPAGERFGKVYPDRENYPPTSAWGSRGWSYTTREDAEKKFISLP